MCYSGKCAWEGPLGDCTLTIKERQLIEQQFDLVSPCMVPEDPEHAEYIEQNRNKLHEAHRFVLIKRNEEGVTR